MLLKRINRFQYCVRTNTVSQTTKRIALVTDKDLLKEVTKELWQSVKKLRPGLSQDARMQLVLKALITIGDHPNPIEAAMVVGTCLELEVSEESSEGEETQTSNQNSKLDNMPEGRKVVRRKSAGN